MPSRKLKKIQSTFFKYARETLETKTTVGPLTDPQNRNQLTDNDHDIVRILAQQYSSTFSKPRPQFDPKAFLEGETEGKLTEITVTVEDILEAINEMPNDTSPGPDTWPSLLLKNCARSLAEPLRMILQKSLDTGEIPEKLLEAHITPIFKGGSRQLAENYRPISLTSPVAKVFERVIRKHIIAYLTENDRIKCNQHGFRKGRSCLSQLLDHHDRIIEALENQTHYDVIYTDFSKAFDKCDFAIICEKLMGLGISGRVGRWIHNFLTKRKFRVVIDGTSSESHEVISSVPQGTILAPTLFLIMINDISDNISECDIQTFADDTKISKSIKTDNDHLPTVELSQALQLDRH